MTDAFNDVFAKVFVPPALPTIPGLPWGSKSLGVQDAIKNALEVFYFAGVKDGAIVGFALGVVAAVVVLQLVQARGVNRASAK